MKTRKYLAVLTGALITACSAVPSVSNAVNAEDNPGLQLQTVLIDNGGKNLWTTESWGGKNITPNTSYSAVSIRDYYENGSLNYEVRNTESEEISYKIGLRSRCHGETVRVFWNDIPQYSNLTADGEWKKVSLPIRDLIDFDPDSGLDLNNLWYISVSGIKKGKTLEFQNVTITSPDDEHQYPFVKVNQAGYESNGKKSARISYFEKFGSLEGKTWELVNAESGNVAKSGILSEPTVNDHLSGESVHIINFDDVSETGTYYIRIPDAGLNPDARSARDVTENLDTQNIRSVNFTIEKDQYADLLRDLMKYFYYQRQGIDLDSKYAGDFARKNLHPDDVAVKRWSDRDNPDAETFDVSGGWYDAGDYGKYTCSSALAINDLLFAYELYPEIFDSISTDIPETDPENPLYADAPSILSETKWELDMLMKLEHNSKDGSFYIASNYKDGVIYLEDTLYQSSDFNSDPSERDLRSHLATASACAVFAHAYLVYKNIPVYSDYAEECLATAERAWKWLNDSANEQHPSIDAGNRTYKFEQDELDRELFWSAGVLYRAEKSAGKNADEYENFMLQNLENENVTKCFTNASMGYSHKAHSFLGYFHYLYQNDSPNPDIVKSFSAFEKWKKRIYSYDQWGTTVPQWGYWWGSNRHIALNSMTLMLESRLNDGKNNIPEKTADSMQNAFNYLLGVNPVSFSYVSGYGENSVKNIFSAIYSKDARLEPYRCPDGYFTEGTNYYNNRSLSKFDGKCYMDSDAEWTTNENTIYGNASMILLTASIMSQNRNVKGDVNSDGNFSVSDIVLFQEWLLAVPDAVLENWKNADFNNDGKLNVFDLTFMKREFFNKQT